MACFNPYHLQKDSGIIGLEVPPIYNHDFILFFPQMSRCMEDTAKSFRHYMLMETVKYLFQFCNFGFIWKKLSDPQALTMTFTVCGVHRIAKKRFQWNFS